MRWYAFRGSSVVASCAFWLRFAEVSDKNTKRADRRSYLILDRVGLVEVERGFARMYIFLKKLLFVFLLNCEAFE